ncbi:RagB/SusD family nutrient uptake outer membrane protein [Plebeiibacterium sediminum]|uniref:RagB/SusD family nutrient uptake outer membrane protein n=1 Tax=Plebeiibacterium sediminum TaxID=2992112 RepID=A0AAE3M208_9BACT|nr:RagB/SusD family nutrient uptake outer membrane protein [Plebeiobacterium sediminum]MCW3785831.1 RagB/SusD family nutrient uptake outer membrane protein [Plebeiobacterium sediminum]
MKRHILFLLISLVVLSSCEDLFDPAIENLKDLDLMYDDPVFAQGVLTQSYRYLPNMYRRSSWATDDAVSNDRGSSWVKMNTGSWSASSNPVDMWVEGYGSIQYINTFLEKCDDIQWTTDPEAAELFNMRLKGEAYGLRGIFLYYLLRNHAGYGTNGELLGVPILTEFQDAHADFNVPRATFQQCVDQILSDFDKALLNLPTNYNSVGDLSEVPDKYKDMVTLSSTYNRVMGDFAKQLVDGQIVMAYRSKVTLLAASPAFQGGTNTTTWADAAVYSSNALNIIGGLSGFDEDGDIYYKNTGAIDALANGNNFAEILWRENYSTNAFGEERDNFPPSMHGNGRMNPTQNLVDAFPDVNGYPITLSSDYSSEDPFANRDPRLAQYILFNGGQIGSTTISTGSASGTEDGINALETSTRTGYYMKKRLREDVLYDTQSTASNENDKWQGKKNFKPRIRYTELFLNYAEAANEAYGPMGAAPGADYSAYDIIKAIRARAGVGAGNGDAYLESIKGNQDEMRTLIRNERRLELCFEGFRFWDLRRWAADLTETAKGYDASTGEVFDVEARTYSDYMTYGPIPYSEILKYDNLIQNRGWE